MFLEKIKIIHFRKFNKSNNEVVLFNNYSDNSINIANISTLIVGQNNAGKSTFFKVFEILSKNEQILSSDFNYDYLNEYVDDLISGEVDANNNYYCPTISFEMTINISDDNDDVITPAIPFFSISSLEESNKGLLIVEIKLKDENLYRSRLSELLGEYKKYKLENEEDNPKLYLLNKICKLIDEIGTIQCFYNSQRKIDFKFSDLFNYKLIDALSVNNEFVLSKQFKSILKFHFMKGDIIKDADIDTQINELNSKIEKLLENKPTNFINSVFESIVSKNRVSMSLQGSISFDKILDDSVKYFYNEGDFFIPEDHYGLGYTKLVSIIANLLEYIEKKPEKQLDNKISIIAIEEPETFMHPQLQKCFIKNINDVLAKILDLNDKKLKCQLVISTHSPFIISNKIEEASSINNINFFGVIKNKTSVALLNDELFNVNGDKQIFNNIKKHMSFSIAEALFADAVILVEGFAEEKMIPYFLNNYPELKNKYIQIVNINGAHGFIYQKLLAALKIPAVILTDVDFKIKSNNSTQITDYEGQYTTNKTIEKNIVTNSLSKLKSCQIDLKEISNIKIFIQEKENGYCATSFEEALILANINSDIIFNALAKFKRNSFYKLVDYKKNKSKSRLLISENINSKSKKIYNTIGPKKGDFITILLQEVISSKDILATPSYIKKAFEYIAKEIE